jgi:hypothetical protein
VTEWRHASIAVGDCFLHKSIKPFHNQGISSTGAKDNNNEDPSQEDKEEFTIIAEAVCQRINHINQINQINHD